MVEISDDFAEAIVATIEERFAPEILWAVTGENYMDDRCSTFKMKLRLCCNNC
jgi:hypothetical protein